MRARGIFLAFVICASLFAGTEDWKKTYALSGKPEIRVDTNDAEIRVYSSDRKDVEALVTTRGYSISKGEVSITERQSGNRIELNIHTRNLHILSFNYHKSVQVDLNIPKQADLDVHSGDGKIIAEDVNGNASLRSGDGDIRIENGKGVFTIQTGDGKVECRSIEGELRADTKDGRVQVDGVFTRLDLQTGDGSIDADARPGSKMASGWSVRTGDGNISLGLPEGFAADLEVHTGDGHISVDLPVTVQGSVRSNAIKGKINGGGQLLEIKTGDGSVALKRT
jgi:hypothetical protein